MVTNKPIPDQTTTGHLVKFLGYIKYGSGRTGRAFQVDPGCGLPDRDTMELHDDIVVTLGMFPGEVWFLDDQRAWKSTPYSASWQVMVERAAMHPRNPSTTIQNDTYGEW